MADYDDTPQPTSKELAALELYHQLLNLSPDNGDRSVMVTLRMPNGRHIGDVWLSTQDVQTAADKLNEAAVQQADLDDPPAAPLPELPEADAAEIAEMIGRLQDFANGSQG
jgi:hypothetical protein